jgi:hypothetical protein
MHYLVRTANRSLLCTVRLLQSAYPLPRECVFTEIVVRQRSIPFCVNSATARCHEYALSGEPSNNGPLRLPGVMSHYTTAVKSRPVFAPQNNSLFHFLKCRFLSHHASAQQQFLRAFMCERLLTRIRTIKQTSQILC